MQPVAWPPDADANHVAARENMHTTSDNSASHNHLTRTAHIVALVCNLMVTQVVKNYELTKPGVAQDECIVC